MIFSKANYLDYIFQRNIPLPKRWPNESLLVPLIVPNTPSYMNSPEAQKQLLELQKVMKQASQIVENLQKLLPSMEEPAMNAQCSVIRAFIYQTQMQEQTLTSMLKSKSTQVA